MVGEHTAQGSECTHATLRDPLQVLVCIVNYRTGPLTVSSLDALAGEVHQRGNIEVVVVDNCSEDGSASLINRAITFNGWESWARVVEAPRNGGFAYGNNLAVGAALASSRPPEIVFLLNPDTVARPGAIARVSDYFSANPEVAVVGSRILNPDGTVRPSTFRFHTLLGELELGLRLRVASRLLHRWVVPLEVDDGPTRVEWVSGAAMAIRSSVFDAVGLLDENYFLYFEETDFCLRAHRAGFQVWHLPQSEVVHLVGQSSGVTGEQRRLRRVPEYYFESRRRYFEKNHGWFYALCCDALWSMGYSSWRVRRLMQGKLDPDPPRYLRDFVRFSVRRTWRQILNPGLRRPG